MGKFLTFTSIALTCFLSAFVHGQGGGMGGGGFQGGGLQGGQGSSMRELDNSVRAFEEALSRYLNGEEIKSILTPGETNEWKLDLKAGQVVIAEARSEAFDPALEVVDEKNKVLASNDDRFTGDQRPLLLWRCTQAGSYSLHARCFHDKSGGQFFLRFKTYDSVDLSSGSMVEQDVDTHATFLLRIPMKAGEMKSIVPDFDNRKYMGFQTGAIIAPGGVPDVPLTRQISDINGAFMAPVAGDYYMMAQPWGGNQNTAKIRVGTKEIVAEKLTRTSQVGSATATTNMPALWEISVKAGELLEVSTPELALTPQFALEEEPNVSKFDVSKQESNPFVPGCKVKPTPDGPAFDNFQARARDGRYHVFYARRDTKLWIASGGQGKDKEQYTIAIKPAASSFVVDQKNDSKLRVGNTDYWTFDAQAGDVMMLNSDAMGFCEHVVVRDPDLGETVDQVAAPDQTSLVWNLVIQRPGRYIVAVSCLGDGGGGGYSLSRKVLHAKEFGKGSPAQSEIAGNQIQIWKFTALPNDPLLLHWKSAGGYQMAIYDDKGHASDLPRQGVDEHNSFGILKVNQPQTYVIVFTGNGSKGSYYLDLSNIPGYKAGK